MSELTRSENGNSDISTYLAERLGQGISALCGRMEAKNISPHFVGCCRQGISALTMWESVSGGYQQSTCGRIMTGYISTHYVEDGTMEYNFSFGGRI
jgi:hypothetical protein